MTDREPATNDQPRADTSIGVTAKEYPRYPPASQVRPALSGALALLIGVAAFAAVWLMARPLSLLLAGAVIAAAITPLVRTLERRVPRLAAILVIYLVVAVVAGSFIALTVPPLVG
jgi:predicted PurR-regulated permease PerM